MGDLKAGRASSSAPNLAWRSAKTGGEASDAEDDEDPSGGGNAGEGGSAGTTGKEEEEEGAPSDDAPMSLAHRTGVAKLPSVVEWLRHALGGGGASSGSGGGGGGQAAAPKFLVFAHHKCAGWKPSE